MFPQRALILTGPEDEPAPDDTLGKMAGVRSTIYVLWMQESQAMTLYNPPLHLNSQSSYWLPHWSLVLKTDKTENLLSYFTSKSYLFSFFFFFFYIIFFWQLSVSPSTRQQTVSEDTTLQSSASVYTTRNQFQQAAEKKNKESGQFSGER